MVGENLASRLYASLASAVGAAPRKGPFLFDPAQQYLMPAHFGPLPQSDAAIVYPQVTTIAVSFITDPDALARLLPAGFTVAETSRVTVYYAQNLDLDWLAGGGYNLLGVNADVHFHGQSQRIDGAYCLALWENDPIPITFGRELLGIPKIYAEIDDHQVADGVWRASARLNGQSLVSLAVADLAAATAEQMAAAESALKDGSWFGWRYVPRVGEAGSAVSHATVVRTGGRPRQLSLGRGEVQWGEVNWKENPTQQHIVNALRQLPMVKLAEASVSEGETWLYTRGPGTCALE